MATCSSDVSGYNCGYILRHLARVYMLRLPNTLGGIVLPHRTTFGPETLITLRKMLSNSQMMELDPDKRLNDVCG